MNCVQVTYKILTVLALKAFGVVATQPQLVSNGTVHHHLALN